MWNMARKSYGLLLWYLFGVAAVILFLCPSCHLKKEKPEHCTNFFFHIPTEERRLYSFGIRLSAFQRAGFELYHQNKVKKTRCFCVIASECYVFGIAVPLTR